MNNLRKILEKYEIKPKGYRFIGKIKVIDTDKGKLVYKENSNNYDIYEYLKTRGFTFFPRSLNQKNENYDLLEYIEEINVPNEQKLSDLIHLAGILHRKTSFQKEIDMDLVKEIYESMQKEVDYLLSYYTDLNQYIDTVIFMSPSEYLLVSNIDLIYYLLTFVKVESENWYQLLKKKKTIRYSMIHNNLSLNHTLVSNNRYLISWSKAKLDMPIYDLVKIYEENYYDIDLDNLLREYQEENQLDEEEYLFLLLKLALPKRIEFIQNTYKDCYELNKYIVYLTKIASLVQKMDKKVKKV